MQERQRLVISVSILHISGRAETQLGLAGGQDAQQLGSTTLGVCMQPPPTKPNDEPPKSSQRRVALHVSLTLTRQEVVCGAVHLGVDHLSQEGSVEVRRTTEKLYSVLGHGPRHISVVEYVGESPQL
jgi:hypothetical protein